MTDLLVRACIVLLIKALDTRIQQGEILAVHCRGGVGRAGTIAACTLLQRGMVRTSAEAIAYVRARRSGAVESRRQEEFIKKFNQVVRT